MAPANPSVAVWNFKNHSDGWTAVDDTADLLPTRDGLSVRGKSNGFAIVSPKFDFPSGKVALVTLIVKNQGADPFATLAVGPGFRSDDSRYFLIPTSGKWETVVVAIPTVGAINRLRLIPMEGRGTVVLRSIRVDMVDAVPADRWADPRQLRGKEIVVAGQWATLSDFGADWLVRNPDFTKTFPGNGVVMPLTVDRESLRKLGQSGDRAFLHDLIWNTTKLDWAMLAPEVARLRAVRWHHVTANYVNATLGDHSDGGRQPDLRSDTDWASVENNTRLMGRVCREAGLRGVWLDTEQYGGYRVPEGQSKPAGFREGNFPFGRDTPEVLRRRGAQWIRALQREFPAVRVIVTFAWSPDTAVAGFLKGVAPFLDGVLAGIREPGRLVHGYENSFYYGWGVNSPYAKQGYDGSHRRFQRMRLGQRDWRKFAADPGRYDRFVEIGTGAWAEDHPNAPWSGWPMGLDASIWSNLPLAVQHTDKTVWLWSEHTDYVAAFRDKQRPNPFLRAVLNRALPPVGTSFRNDFRVDPMHLGWTFDFDMGAIGAKLDPDNARPVMDDKTVAYRWVSELAAVVVESVPPSGPSQEMQRPVPGQRQRFVRPVTPLRDREPVTLETTFTLDHAGDGKRPLWIGLFETGSPLTDAVLALRCSGPMSWNLVGAGKGWKRSAGLVVTRQIGVGDTVRVALRWDPRQRSVSATVYVGGSRIGSAKLVLGAGETLLPFDEIGVALSEALATSGETPQRLRFHSFHWKRG